MPTIRKKIERGFTSFTRKIYRHRLKTIAGMILFIAFFVSALPQLRVDTSTEGFLHESDPILISYNNFRDQFGRDEVILVAINPENVFDIGFLKKLKALHQEIERNVPHLDDVTSLINARNTTGDADRLIVEDLFEKFPENEQELATIKERALSNPLYKNMILSEDAKFTTIMIRTNAYSSEGAAEDVLAGFEDLEAPSAEGTEETREFLTDEENAETVMAIREILTKYDGPDFPVTIGGSPVTTHDLKQSMMKDMRRFMVMAVGVISLLLFIQFRRVWGVILPLAIVILSLLSTIGLMARFGVPIKLPTQILPSFLLAVGVGASVHVLAIFYRKLTQTPDKEEAITYALGHSGLPIVMTSLTTAAGLGSFAWAEIAPLSDLGRFASSGVLISLVYTIILLPALIAIAPMKLGKSEKELQRQALMDRILISTASLATSHPWKIIAASAVLIIVSLISAFTLRFSHNPLVWFPKDSDTRVSTELLDDKMRGTVAIEVVVDTKKENGLYDPAVQNKLEQLPGVIRSQLNDPALFIGQTVAVNDILKEINQALNENREQFYSIPQNRDLVAQELFLFENSGSDDLEDFVDSQFSKARVIAKSPWVDSYIYANFLLPLEKKLDEFFQGTAEARLTGMIPIFARTLKASMESAAQSYVIAAFVITIMMIILIGDVKVGLYSMIPNLTPIIVTMGVMGFLNFPLDMFTMLIGSIAIGLAVDDTIHFMHNFRRYHHDFNDAPLAVRETLLTTGRAMLVTTVALACGFFIFMFATMNNLFNFGLLTGVTLIMALLADFLLAPAIMTILTRRGGMAPVEDDINED